MFKNVLLLALLGFSGLNADTSLLFDTDLESAQPGDVLIFDNPESEGMGEEEVYVVPDGPSPQGIVYIAEDVPNNLPYPMVPESELGYIQPLSLDDDVFVFPAVESEVEEVPNNLPYPMVLESDLIHVLPELEGMEEDEVPNNLPLSMEPLPDDVIVL